jgi:DNA-binding beta-propeller fold protein YncE
MTMIQRIGCLLALIAFSGADTIAATDMQSIVRLTGNVYSDMFGVAIDPNTGYIYFSASDDAIVYVITDPDTEPVVFAGKFNRTGETGDGGPASQATLFFPAGLNFDKNGDLYIVDDCRIRKVTMATSIIRTVAGSGRCSLEGTVYTGEGGLATAATLSDPFDVAIDDNLDVYIGDFGGLRVVDHSTGTIRTLYNDSLCESIAFDPITGDMYVATFLSDQILKFDPKSGKNVVVAGTEGVAGFTEDGRITKDTILNDPYYLRFVPGTRTMVFAESANFLVRSIDLDTNTLATIAGTGKSNPHVDGPADPRDFNLYYPWAAAFDVDGTFVVVESNGNDGFSQPLFLYLAQPSEPSDGAAASESCLFAMIALILFGVRN